MWITIALIVAVLNLIIISSPANDETHEAAFEWTHPLWGTWDGTVATNGLDSRDFDLTLSAHTQYLSFHISLWFVSAGLYWRKYADSAHLDCADDHVSISTLRPLVEDAILEARVLLTKTYITSGTSHMERMQRAAVVVRKLEGIAQVVKLDVASKPTLPDGFQEGSIDGDEH